MIEENKEGLTKIGNNKAQQIVIKFNDELDLTQAQDEIRKYRLEDVRNEFKFMYKNYKSFAFGHDELSPLNKSYIDK